MQNGIHLAVGAIETPLDYERALRFDVCRRRRRFDGTRYVENVRGFDDLDHAIAAIGNTEQYAGDSLWVDEIALTSGNEVCVFAAEWDEGLGRYLN